MDEIQYSNKLNSVCPIQGMEFSSTEVKTDRLPLPTV